MPAKPKPTPKGSDFPVIQLVDVDGACAILGGSKPISRTTLYDGIKQGRYPAPIKMADKASRWVISELEDSIRALMRKRSA